VLEFGEGGGETTLTFSQIDQFARQYEAADDDAERYWILHRVYSYGGDFAVITLAHCLGLPSQCVRVNYHQYLRSCKRRKRGQKPVHIFPAPQPKRRLPQARLAREARQEALSVCGFDGGEDRHGKRDSTAVGRFDSHGRQIGTSGANKGRIARFCNDGT